MSDKTLLDAKISFRLPKKELDDLQSLAMARSQTVGEVLRAALDQFEDQPRPHLTFGNDLNNVDRVLHEYQELFAKLYPKSDYRATRIRDAISFIERERAARVMRQRAAKSFYA